MFKIGYRSIQLCFSKCMCMIKFQNDLMKKMTKNRKKLGPNIKVIDLFQIACKQLGPRLDLKVALCWNWESSSTWGAVLQESSVRITVCMLGTCKISCFSCRLLTFISKLLFLKISFRNTVRVSNGLDPNQDRRFVLIWIQTVCEGFQQTTKVAAIKVWLFVIGTIIALAGPSHLLIYHNYYLDCHDPTSGSRHVTVFNYSLTAT